jgi:steroid 5-alpha reductase family enzyme
MLAAIAAAAFFMCFAMTIAWAIQRRTGNSGWIDTVWSFAVGAAAFFLALVPAGASNSLTSRQVLVAALVAVWAARLGGYIAFRSAGAAEDPRYAWLMKEWGESASGRLFKFLQVQALAGLLLVLSVFAAAHNPSPDLNAKDFIGVAVFLIALGGAAMSDDQLRRFKADPSNRGRVCDTGLWAYSRHPNYFFEWLGWVAFPIIAIAPGYLWGYTALLAPILMYVLLVHVSGIPPLEAHMMRSRGKAFADYCARVNAFFPGPQRNPQRSASTS